MLDPHDPVVQDRPNKSSFMLVQMGPGWVVVEDLYASGQRLGFTYRVLGQRLLVCGQVGGVRQKGVPSFFWQTAHEDMMVLVSTFG